MLFRRLAKRDTLREAVFLWITPFDTARITSGSAALNAAAAAAWSPRATASSNLRMKVRTRERRDLLTSVRASISPGKFVFYRMQQVTLLRHTYYRDARRNHQAAKHSQHYNIQIIVPNTSP